MEVANFCSVHTMLRLVAVMPGPERGPLPGSEGLWAGMTWVGVVTGAVQIGVALDSEEDSASKEISDSSSLRCLPHLRLCLWSWEGLHPWGWL